MDCRTRRKSNVTIYRRYIWVPGGHHAYIESGHNQHQRGIVASSASTSTSHIKTSIFNFSEF